MTESQLYEQTTPCSKYSPSYYSITAKQHWIMYLEASILLLAYALEEHFE